MKLEIEISDLLNENECNVIRRVAKKAEARLLIGLKEYGSLQFVGEKAEPAFWIGQIPDEVMDGGVYLGIAEEAQEQAKKGNG